MRRTSFVKPVIIALITLFFLMARSNTFAQTPYTPDIGNVGLPTNGTLHGTDIETVQLNNGNLHIDIPLLHLPGIGMDTDIHFTYDSHIWNHAIGPENETANAPTWTLITMSRPYWQLKDPMAGYLKWGEHPINWNCHGSTGSVTEGLGTNTDIDFVSFKDENGTAHSFALNGMIPSGGIPGCSVPGVVGAFPTVDLAGHYESYSIDQDGDRIIVNPSFALPGNSSLGLVSFTDKHGTNYTFSGQQPGASVLQRLGVAALNLFKMIDNTSSDLIMCANCRELGREMKMRPQPIDPGGTM